MREGLSSANSGLSGLSGNVGDSGAATTGLDVIEVNMNGAWLESYFTYGGPDEATSLDEVRFFDC